MNFILGGGKNVPLMHLERSDGRHLSLSHNRGKKRDRDEEIRKERKKENVRQKTEVSGLSE